MKSAWLECFTFKKESIHEHITWSPQWICAFSMHLPKGLNHSLVSITSQFSSLLKNSCVL